MTTKNGTQEEYTKTTLPMSSLAAWKVDIIFGGGGGGGGGIVR